jgi:hypothetical protein
MRTFKKSFAFSGAALVVSFAVLTGCGGSDKPQYCSDISTLQDSVSQLSSISIEAGVLDNVKTDLETVQTDAQTAVDSAKTDFPSETSALEDSINTASTSIQDLPASPSAAEIAAVALNVSAVVNAAQDFESATSSACN